MILKEFPDYQWLKKQSESYFHDGKNWKGATLPKKEWPLVFLNVKTTQCERKDIKGPFSIFTNVQGTSFVTTGNKKVKLNQDCFFISNKAQYYSLHVDETAGTETFNIHMGQGIWEDFIRSFISNVTTLTDNPFEENTYGNFEEFPNQLFYKSGAIGQYIRELHSLCQQQPDSMLMEDKLAQLCEALALSRQDIIRTVKRISAARPGTKKEIYKRVCLASDYILSNLINDISLDELAVIACLSKFHFLRAFKEVHGKSPYQFILENRIAKSKVLLEKRALSVTDVTFQSGFSDIAVFSRMFRKFVGVSPTQYMHIVK